MLKTILRTLFYTRYGLRMYLSSFYYKNLFKSFGKNTFILGAFKCFHPENISIGNNCTVNEGVFINASGGVSIGNNTTISSHTIIHTGQLDLEVYPKKKHINKKVVIGNEVWICSGVNINPGITIGNGSVVASGSVVTKNIPPHCLFAGVPAKKIRGLKYL